MGVCCQKQIISPNSLIDVPLLLDENKQNNAQIDNTNNNSINNENINTINKNNNSHNSNNNYQTFKEISKNIREPKKGKKKESNIKRRE